MNQHGRRSCTSVGGADQDGRITDDLSRTTDGSMPVLFSLGLAARMGAFAGWEEVEL
jgi:hypothetical protein